jgi:hypothetical protein
MGEAFSTHGRDEKYIGRPRHRWEDNIIYITEIVWEVVDWIRLAERYQ